MFGCQLTAMVNAHEVTPALHLYGLANQMVRNRVAVGIERDQVIRSDQP